MKTPPVSVVLDKKTINDMMEIAIELNKKLAMAIIEEMKKTNLELTMQLIEDIQKKKRENERLYNLKQIAEMIGIKYKTLANYKLPFQTIGNNARKMYSLNEVRQYLQR